jgi:hypothetical protein
MTTRPRNEWAIVFRGLRVLFAVTVAVFAAAMLGSLFWGSPEGHPTHRAGKILFILFFVGAFLVPVAVFTAVFFSLDLLARSTPGLQRLGHPLVGLSLGAGIGFGAINGLVGTVFLFFFVYWLLAGRVIGRPGWDWRAPWRAGPMEIAYLVFALWLLGPMAVSLASLGYAAVARVDPGTPPFVVQYDHQMDADLRRAMARFPDAQSCLRDGARAEVREDLLEMDWDRIRNGSDAEVCIFRLLHGWGGVGEAQSWLEAQGFGVGEGFSSERPHETVDGVLSVHAGWSIRNDGPRFPTRGPIRRAFAATPYGMSVVTTFDAEGAELLFVSVSFSTL